MIFGIILGVVGLFAIVVAIYESKDTTTTSFDFWGGIACLVVAAHEFGWWS